MAADVDVKYTVLSRYIGTVLGGGPNPSSGITVASRRQPLVESGPESMTT